MRYSKGTIYKTGHGITVIIQDGLVSIDYDENVQGLEPSSYAISTNEEGAKDLVAVFANAFGLYVEGS